MGQDRLALSWLGLLCSAMSAAPLARRESPVDNFRSGRGSLSTLPRVRPILLHAQL